MRDLFKILLLPPVAIFIAMGIGIFLQHKRHRAGLPLVAGAFGLLIVLSMPLTSGILMATAQRGVTPFDPATAKLPRGTAIVILSAGVDEVAPEFDRSGTVDFFTLLRLRYGAKLHRELHLPVLVTGGSWGQRGLVVADLMAKSLETDFQVKVRWVERLAHTTKGNAEGSADILKAEGYETVVLVTHAWHMPRATRAFERAGLEVIEAPTAFEISPGFRIGGLVPNAGSFHTSYYAIHELAGRVWYAITA